MKIITIDREFGSGGRELGKRLSEALQIPCYDQEIIEEVAKLHNLDPAHVEHISESDVRKVYPATIGRRFYVSAKPAKDSFQILASERDVINTLARQGDCVIVGRGADLILQEFNPFNMFIYADQESKLKRCIERTKGDEREIDIQRQMKRIDPDRAAFRELLTDSKWGQKESYHLCVNTSGKTIKSLIPAIKAYVDCWFSI
ncbi:MAG: cytidylate kinase-like family protein [Lachnospiraceae bacterium]|nr:cytidylate kinase-like family protein [Lachnospiraceae bacterium]